MDLLHHYGQLVNYDEWANLEVIASLRRSGTPPARSQQWIAHILSAEHVWLSRLLHRQQPYAVWPELSLEECEREAKNLATSWREYLNGLASGEICFVVGWSGDVKQAQKRAAEAKNGVDIAYTIPKEGTQMFFDNLAIPKDSRNVAEAHAFIDYLMRPEVAAKNTNFLSYANGNLASQALIDPAILNDRTVYPDEATMAKLYTIDAHDQRTIRLMNRLWTKVKTGR